MRYQRGDKMEIWENPHFRPNPLVYKLQCAAFGIDVNDIEIEELVMINPTCLHRRHDK